MGSRFEVRVGVGSGVEVCVESGVEVSVGVGVKSGVECGVGVGLGGLEVGGGVGRLSAMTASDFAMTRQTDAPGWPLMPNRDKWLH